MNDAVAFKGKRATRRVTETRKEAREWTAVCEEPGAVWRCEVASRLAVVVDGEDYFRALRTALASAERQIMFIGWDFDFLLEMFPDESDENGMAPDGRPNALGPYLEALCDDKPDLDIYLLKWNGAALIAPGSLIPSIALAYFGKDQVHFSLDSHHPTGACHHQKIVVIDDELAFCGGIDATLGRWDTTGHLANDPRRRTSGGRQRKPWHDVACAVTGDAAKALGDLARARWYRATGEILDTPGTGHVPEWPGHLDTLLTDVSVGIARTEPPFDGSDLINEIERVTLAAIRQARRVIYIESQYLAAESVLSVIEERLAVPDGPEVVILNPREGEHFIEHSAMHAARGRWLLDVRERFPERLRCLYPVNGGDQAIYVHAKVLLVDDHFVKIGSSNINDRSLGFDTECDLCFEAKNDVQREIIAGLMLRLLSEHLGSEPSTVGSCMRSHASVIAAIDELNRPYGRRLADVPVDSETLLDSILTRYRIFDPRFEVGKPTRSGQGMRPRHITTLITVAAVAGFFWQKSRRKT
jgi:phospholipase D1/2